MKADLCVTCNKRPRLSVLARCAQCLTAQVEEERRARAERKAKSVGSKRRAANPDI
jgi:hypothetical protein